MQIAQTSSLDAPVLTVAEIHALADKLAQAQETAEQQKLHCEQLSIELNQSIKTFNAAQQPGSTALKLAVNLADAVFHLIACFATLALMVYVTSNSPTTFEGIVRGVGACFIGTFLFLGLEVWRKSVLQPFRMRRGIANTSDFWAIYPRSSDTSDSSK